MARRHPPRGVPLLDVVDAHRRRAAAVRDRRRGPRTARRARGGRVRRSSRDRPGLAGRGAGRTLGGRDVVRGELAADVPHDERPYLFFGHVARIRGRLTRIQPWSAEQPNLYRVLVSAARSGGRTVEVVEQRVGFRSVEVRDRQLLVNGAPGPDPRRQPPRPPSRSRTGGDAPMTCARDLVTMKRHNVNAVRCSHYPNDPRFLRPVRRARPLRGRRGQHREPRLHHQPVPRPALPRRAASNGSAAWSSATRNHPSRHRVVARQRERVRRRARRRRRVGAPRTTRRDRCTTRAR